MSEQQQNGIQAARKHTRGLLEDLQQRFQRLMPQNASPTEILSDPWRSLTTIGLQLHNEQEIRAGISQLSVPLFGFQRVALDNAGGVIQTRMPTVGAGEPGVYDVSTWPHGMQVLVVTDSTTRLATAIAAAPQINGNISKSFSDFIVQGSGVGFFASPQYRTYASLNDSGGTLMFSGDRPIDGLPGDYTVMGSTGVGMHLDDEMAFIRSSEVSGLFIFREDGFVRLTGEQLAIESPGVFQESGLAQYELYLDGGASLYPWELYGLASPAELQTESRGTSAAYQGPWATLEPANTDLEQINRFDQFGGYLGQGQHLIVSAPQFENEDAVNTLANPIERRGLFRQQVMVDGTYLVETARQLFFAKAIDIPVLRRTSPPDLPHPETAYKGSGQFGDGDGHIVKQLASDDPATLTMAAEEAYSYASSWQGLNAAVYNPNVEVTYPTASSSAPEFDLSQDDQVALPDPEKVKIDHRYGEVDLYRVLSLIGLLPNGDIVIEDGFGASIKLTQGRVEISGTAVSVNAAKTFNVFAGKVAINGQRFVDISCGEQDVRIKAERNLMLLSGNGGLGGMLLENRGFATTGEWPEEPGDIQAAGIAIKSNNSFVGLYGGDLFLKSGPASAGGRQGQIIIDAGSGNLTSRAQLHSRYTQSSFYDHYGSSPTSVRKSSVFNESYSRLSGALGVDGQLLVSGGVQAIQNFVTLTGHFASQITDNYRGLVGRLQDPDLIRTNIQDLQQSLQDARTFGQETSQNIRENLESTDKPLNPQSIRNMSFGFPSSDAYQASNVTLAQPRWQRLAGNSTRAWNEPFVKYQGGETTLPWPGKATWNREDSFRVVGDVEESNFYDKNLARPKDPSVNRAIYEGATLGSGATGSLLSSLRTY